jgi:hypothetical protein
MTSPSADGLRWRAARPGDAAGLLREPELWAPGHGIHRLELTVMAHNQRAFDLYQRMGYVTEGRRRECLLVDGRLADELYMAKLLNTEGHAEHGTQHPDR